MIERPAPLWSVGVQVESVCEVVQVTAPVVGEQDVSPAPLTLATGAVGAGEGVAVTHDEHEIVCAEVPLYAVQERGAVQVRFARLVVTETAAEPLYDEHDKPVLHVKLKRLLPSETPLIVELESEAFGIADV